MPVDPETGLRVDKKIPVYRVYVGNTVASFDDIDAASRYATAQAKEDSKKIEREATFRLEQVWLTREKYVKEVEGQEATKVS